jgi:hypothetical protein
VKEYEAWVGRGMKTQDEPKKLMITIEEAHKFLNPQAARQTIFGTIAREMRKYWVTLLDRRSAPSGIDDEILSQIGTRITAQLERRSRHQRRADRCERRDWTQGSTRTARQQAAGAGFGPQRAHARHDSNASLR